MHLCNASILFIYLFVYLYMYTVHCTLKAKIFPPRRKAKTNFVSSAKKNSQISLLKARYCVFLLVGICLYPQPKKPLKSPLLRFFEYGENVDNFLFVGAIFFCRFE